MPKPRSFAGVVWDKYSDGIENAVSEYIAENFRGLELRSHTVQEPDEVYLSSLHFHRLIPYDAPGDKIKFDVVVSADIAIFETFHSDTRDGEVTRWFRVSCEALLSNGLSGFQIKSIEIYDYLENSKHGLLTDTLVPIIYTAELEKIAEDILAEVYPEALAAPMAIDVREFAKRMGLSVRAESLSRGGTIFGEMIFRDCSVEHFDVANQRFNLIDVEQGTILVDPEIYFLRTLGSWNNTVIHECVHWRKHRKAFELERLYNENARMIRCQVSEGTKDEQKRSDTEWMEWHANSLAPRIMMPLRPFREKAAEVIANLSRTERTEQLPDVISDTIVELSKFFDVSIQAAKIRMIDAGYEEAVGAFEYVDNHYVTPYTFAGEPIEKNQTFSVPATDALIEYAVNPVLRQMLDTGNYLYIDSHYCIDDPKYVVKNEYGLLKLTDYAKTHIDECCLIFERVSRRNDNYGVQRYAECALFQSAVSKTIAEFKYRDIERNKVTDERAKSLKAESLAVKETAKIVRELPATFAGSLEMLMKWRRLTVEQLAENALTSPKTIQRMRNDPGHNWELSTIIAVCIGLQLPPYISFDLVTKAGLAFKATEEHITYKHLLTVYCQSTIIECNEFLEEAGYAPIGREE
jgi:hypothetical protein